MDLDNTKTKKRQRDEEKPNDEDWEDFDDKPRKLVKVIRQQQAPANEELEFEDSQEDEFE
jgi:hypothetical protein